MRKLIEIPSRRYYELDFTVTQGKFGEVRPTSLIIVSDAHTHTERLVFPAYLNEGFTVEDIINKVKGSVSTDFSTLAGDHTMMIHGGDSGTIRKDEDYIKELRELNLQ